MTLIYGGGNVGLMGVVADAVLAAGGAVIGVIPEALLQKEVGHQGLTELKVVESMHQRKMLMSELADGFIAMPGGLGTLEEIAEVLTWAQLGFHDKPCSLLNVAGYYDALLAFLDSAVDKRFVKGVHRSMLLVADQPERLLDALEAHRPVRVAKWIDRESEL